MTKTRQGELPKRSQTNGQQRSHISDLAQIFRRTTLTGLVCLDPSFPCKFVKDDGAVVREKLKGVIMTIKSFKGIYSVHLLPDMLLVIQTKYRW